MSYDGCMKVQVQVAPSQGRGSKLDLGTHPGAGVWSPPHRGADRNEKRRIIVGRLAHVAPSQGRGSKPGGLQTLGRYCRSPPHRGADRNGGVGDHLIPVPAVAPSQGRGSKLGEGLIGKTEQRRPLTGARIETSVGLSAQQLIGRRPLTGARIETASRFHTMWPIPSPPHRGADRNMKIYNASMQIWVAPSQGRGSKHGTTVHDNLIGASPPHRGADRNGNYWIDAEHCKEVAPSQGRGSKHQ